MKLKRGLGGHYAMRPGNRSDSFYRSRGRHKHKAKLHA